MTTPQIKNAEDKNAEDELNKLLRDFIVKPIDDNLSEKISVVQKDLSETKKNSDDLKISVRRNHSELKKLIEEEITEKISDTKESILNELDELKSENQQNFSQTDKKIISKIDHGNDDLSKKIQVVKKSISDKDDFNLEDFLNGQRNELVKKIDLLENESIYNAIQELKSHDEEQLVKYQKYLAAALNPIDENTQAKLNEISKNILEKLDEDNASLKNGIQSIKDSISIEDGFNLKNFIENANKKTTTYIQTIGSDLNKKLTKQESDMLNLSDSIKNSSESIFKEQINFLKLHDEEQLKKIQLLLKELHKQVANFLVSNFDKKIIDTNQNLKNIGILLDAFQVSSAQRLDHVKTQIDHQILQTTNAEKFLLQENIKLLLNDYKEKFDKTSNDLAALLEMLQTSHQNNTQQLIALDDKFIKNQDQSIHLLTKHINSNFSKAVDGLVGVKNDIENLNLNHQQTAQTITVIDQRLVTLESDQVDKEKKLDKKFMLVISGIAINAVLTGALLIKSLMTSGFF